MKECLETKILKIEQCSTQQKLLQQKTLILKIHSSHTTGFKTKNKIYINMKRAVLIYITQFTNYKQLKTTRKTGATCC